jgi:hypothetical protein
MQIRGVHVLGLLAVVLGMLAVLATERYTARYQMLPALDWLESRPPLAEAGRLPPATDLARELVRAVPLLSIQDDARPVIPILGPPSPVQRNIGGIRDAATIVLGVPEVAAGETQPVHVNMEVIVFNRSLRAAAYSELMARVMDVRDPGTGQPQVRLSNAHGDGVWLISPRSGGGTATIIGHRGPVAYEIQVTAARPGATRPEDALDLSARAEAVARQAAAEWTELLEARLAAA